MCQKIDLPMMGRGWGCCGDSCHTFNGDSRDNCKHCNHSRCAESKFEDKEVAFKKDGGVVIARIKPNTDKESLS